MHIMYIYVIAQEWKFEKIQFFILRYYIILRYIILLNIIILPLIFHYIVTLVFLMLR